MKKVYNGSCHCGDIRFEAEMNFDAPTGKCNCSYCSKARSWGIIVKPEAFKLLSKPDNLVEYRFGSMSNGHQFCGRCGIHTFSNGYIEAIGGAFVAVQIASFDNIAPAELSAMKVMFQNGRDNAWMDEPQETRYL